jgi:nicotinate phosphoribosyltransferase
MTVPHSAAFTDLYELTMLQGYWRAGLHRRPACFDLFHRRSPFDGGYALTVGLADALQFLAGARFAPEDVEYLATTGLFAKDFLRRLAKWRFAGAVWAIPEGALAFPFEPILRVMAPLEESQLVESALLNIINFQSLVATKAARICQEAGADNVLEFGMRRAQGLDGALTAARACFIGGCAATSNVEAARILGLRPSGTMAHSWVMAFDDELEAFRRYARTYPEHCILLVDTYDTLRSGLPNAAIVGQEMQGRGERLAGVRLDSGDLARLAPRVRRLLDRAGLHDTQIVASGDLDEYAIRELKRRGAPIDQFGVGCRMIAAHGDEAFTGVYKLAAVADAAGRWRPARKQTDDAHKATLPGVKQLWRLFDKGGAMLADWLELEGAAFHPAGGVEGRTLGSGRRRRLGPQIARTERLLQPVMRQGEIIDDLPTLVELRAGALANLAQLPAACRRLDEPELYPVLLGPRLEAAALEK